MNSEEGQKIEQLNLAYEQIECPYWREELKQVMKNNKPFMEALAQYDADNTKYQTAWMTLRADAQAEGTNPKADPIKELSDIMNLDKSLKKQRTDLQTMFMNDNKELVDHMKKITYLVKQNIQWIIAFGFAINPDFAKTVTPEMTDHLTKTLTNLHTSPKVTALQKMQATVAKK